MKGQALIHVRRWEEARCELARAYQKVEVLASHPIRGRILAAQAEIAARLGDQQAGDGFRVAAREALSQVMEDLESHLQASF